LAEEYSLFSVEPAKQKHRFSMRRSQLEIRMDILACVKAGAEKPTQIMYKANLSWTALQTHLDALEGAELLTPVEYGSRKKYELTDKALTLLLAYDKIIDEVNAPFQKASSTF
jgi:predicted transcriptional regulator